MDAIRSRGRGDERSVNDAVGGGGGSQRRRKRRRLCSKRNVVVAERQRTKQGCIVFPGRPLTQVSNCESAVLPARRLSSGGVPSSSGWFPLALWLSFLARGSRASYANGVTRFRSGRKPVASLRFRRGSRTAPPAALESSMLDAHPRLRATLDAFAPSRARNR